MRRRVLRRSPCVPGARSTGRGGRDPDEGRNCLWGRLGRGEASLRDAIVRVLRASRKVVRADGNHGS
jgi:hypothetical protein